MLQRLARRFNLSATEIQQWRLDPPAPPRATALQRDTDQRRQDWARLNAWLAIYGSAMLFAVFHTQAWPAPIALAILGAVLGWLAMRTQNLIAPITVHALFNLVAFIALYCSTHSAEPQNGNDATTAQPPPVVGSMASSVPMSQLPLRK